METPHLCTVLAVLLAPLVLIPGDAATAAAKDQYVVYIGTYNVRNSKGIYAYRFDAATGRLTSLGLAADTTNASFLVVHPNHRFLYAVNEVPNNEGRSSGAVSAFAIAPKSGKLTLLNQVSSGGAEPCYVSLDKLGKYALVANYTGGSVAVFPMLEDGRLGAASAFVLQTASSAPGGRIVVAGFAC